ncbi:MAG TPA: AMP-dependent synthetase/ligase [Pseudonocardiaceae bacterium]
MVSGDQVAAAVGALTVPALLARNAREHGDRPALTSGIGEGATTLTWAELRRQVAATAHGLRALGLGARERMLIMMSSRPEHWVADLAAVHAGALPCTAYATLPTEQIAYVARHSGATVVVLEGAGEVSRWLPVLDDLPALRRVVVLDEAAIPDGDPRFVSYREVAGHAVDEAAFEEWTAAPGQDDPVAMIYTSGTTGEPKGVVLSHRNVLHQAAGSQLVAATVPHPRSVSYLPLAHIAERMLGIYLPMYTAGHVTICADPARLLETLIAVRPNGFFGVPRVWEKFAAGIQGVLAGLPAEQRPAVDGALETGLRVYRLRAEGREPEGELAERFAAVDKHVLAPMRARLGLDLATRTGSGAAPIPVAVQEFLGSMGIPILEVWGLSETTGSATTNHPERYRPGSVGVPCPGMEVRIAEDGEVLVRGPLVFLGYLAEDGSIRPDTDADGWLATGDVGELDADGFLTITDRKKELIITAAGKNVAPSAVESLLRAHPLVAYAVVVGDRRPYLTALLVLDEDAAPAWAAAHGIPADADLANHPDVLAELGTAVEAANARLSRPEQVKYHRVLPGPWTATTGELTPTLKLRRRAIADRYAAEIDSLYAGQAVPDRE